MGFFDGKTIVLHSAFEGSAGGLRFVGIVRDQIFGLFQNHGKGQVLIFGVPCSVRVHVFRTLDERGRFRLMKGLEYINPANIFAKAEQPARCLKCKPREICKALNEKQCISGIDLVVTTRCTVKKERFAMSLWTMKEVTRVTGVTENALRYYNTKGVLPPTVQEKTGRRQWFYDEEAIEKLKKLLLLKYLDVSIEEAGTAIREDEIYRRTVMKSLEEIKKERDKLDHRIFIAETLAVSFGMDLVEPDEDLSDAEAAALNDVIREVIRKEIIANRKMED